MSKWNDIWNGLHLGVGLGVAVVRCTLENPDPAAACPILSAVVGPGDGNGAASGDGADKLWMCPFAANCLQWEPFPIMQLESEEKEKGGRAAALGPLENEAVRPSVRSPPLFLNSPFVVHCLARCRGATTRRRRETAGAEEEKEGTENQCSGPLVINDVFESMQPPFSSSFFNAKEKYATALQWLTSLPFSLSKAMCVRRRESICATKDQDPQNGSHSCCISIGKVQQQSVLSLSLSLSLSYPRSLRQRDHY